MSPSSIRRYFLNPKTRWTKSLKPIALTLEHFRDVPGISRLTKLITREMIAPTSETYVFFAINSILSFCLVNFTALIRGKQQLDAGVYTDFGDDQVGVIARARVEHLKAVHDTIKQSETSQWLRRYWKRRTWRIGA